MGQIPKPLTFKRLRRFVEIATSKGGKVKETPHAVKDHPERNFDLLDTWSALVREWSVGWTEYDYDNREWKYGIKGISISGRAMTVVVVPEIKTGKIRIITRW